MDSSASIDIERLHDAEATIQSHLDRLESLETITGDDLDEFRRSLPTDPMLARAVQLALPFPWSNVFEYVVASDRQAAYWRTSHDRRLVRSRADREHKRRFGRAARNARGLEGSVERDGRMIPASAAHIADAISDEEIEPDDESAVGERALRRFQELLRV